MQRLRVGASLASRLFSNNCHQGRLWASTAPSSQQEQDTQELNEFFPVVVDAVKDLTQSYRIPFLSEWLVKMLKHNVDSVRWPGCLSTLNAMRELSGQPREAICPEHMHKARFLAWCVEMSHISFLMVDDLVDGVAVRSARPCWHTLPGVGTNAANDAGVVDNLIFQLLQRQFRGSPCYVELMELFRDSGHQSILGRICDAHCLSDGQARFDAFCPQKYATHVKMKASEGTFYMPVAAAMLASGVKDPAAYSVARDIADDMGFILQAKVDYDDCFAEVEGEQFSDISNGRCTWLIVEAKKRANGKQMEILKDNYGHKDQKKVDAVVNLYNELRLKEAFLDSNRLAYDRVLAKIHHNSEKFPPNIFCYVLHIMKSFDSREILFR